jgi:glycosyltransferase involved in cell wall biosynthesis
MPSRSEGFGLAAAEAAACGLPVVASKASSLPEIVHHEQTGILVPPCDASALACAVKRLLNEANLCQQLGQKAREYMRMEFNRDRALDRLAELLRGK